MSQYITTAIYNSFTAAQQEAVDLLSIRLGRQVYMEDAADILTYGAEIEDANAANESDSDRLDIQESSGWYTALAGMVTTVGGDVAESIGVPGVLDGDMVFTQVKTSGAGAQVLTASCSTDSLDFTFQIDPADSTEIFYEVKREL